MDSDQRKLLKLLERAVVALERIAGTEAPVETPKPPPQTEAQRKNLVTLIWSGDTAPAWNRDAR